MESVPTEPAELTEHPDNVVPLYSPSRRREPPLSDAELAEWRRMAPQLRIALRQLQTLSTECPVARQLLAPE